MKALIGLFICLCMGISAQAQSSEYAFRISFKDKLASAYDIQQPQEFLTPRALNRRSRYNIAVDSTDLPVCTSYIDSVLNLTNGVLHCTSRWFNDVVILVSDTNNIGQLSNLPFVAHVQLTGVYPNGYNRPIINQNPSLHTMGFDAPYYGSAWEQIMQLNGQVLHENGFTGSGIWITLIDAGFIGVDNISILDSARAQSRILDRWNFSSRTIEDPEEGDHGTRVLSIIAGNLPQTYVGTAPKASFLLYNSEDLNSEQPIEEDNWVAAAERADSLGTDVITSSLGYNTFDSPFSDYTHGDLDGKTTFIAKGANEAAAKGILVVCSAGNEGANSWQGLLTPGDADSALTIGSVDGSGAASSFSSFGPNASGQVKPDVVALGQGIYSVNSFGVLLSSTGTSFAAPVIAGLAACLMETDSSASPWEIKGVIRQSASLYLSPQNQMGYGLPDFAQAYNQMTGLIPVANINLRFKAKIFPNPVIGKEVFLDLGKNQLGKIRIQFLDIKGNLISLPIEAEYSGTPVSLPIPQFKTGIYLLKITTENGDTGAVMLLSR